MLEIITNRSKRINKVSKKFTVFISGISLLHYFLTNFISGWFLRETAIKRLTITLKFIKTLRDVPLNLLKT